MRPHPPARRLHRARAMLRLLQRHRRRAPAAWPLVLCATGLLAVTSLPVALASTLVLWWVALPVAAALRNVVRQEHDARRERP